MSRISIGIDIGTNSIKALALDEEKNVVGKVGLQNVLRCNTPQMLEHDAMESWHNGTLKIWSAIRQKLAEKHIAESKIGSVCVAAIVPSLTAVDTQNRPTAPGILYGDERGKLASSKPPIENEEFLNFLKWTVQNYPEASGYWPAQTVANSALGNAPVLDTITAFSTMPLFSGESWNEDLCREIQISPSQLPRLRHPTEIIAKIGNANLAAGIADAFSELMVLPVQNPGDVVVTFGSTLLCWSMVNTDIPEPPGLWSFPHPTQAMRLIGGPSNAGGLFIDKIRSLFGFTDNRAEKLINRRTLSKDYGHGHIPVWLPYINGERTPLHNPSLKANLFGLDLSHSNACILRAAHEASGFVIRRHLELTGLPTLRIIASGGGVMSRSWMEAVADATNLPVEIASVPESSALGAACLADIALDDSKKLKDLAGFNSISRIIEPDPLWVEATNERYQKFLKLHDS